MKTKNTYTNLVAFLCVVAFCSFNASAETQIIECDGSSDHIEIQQAVDDLIARSGGIVQINVPVTAWACNIDSSIEISDNVKVVCEEGARINTTSDIDVVILEENGSIDNCHIINSSSSFTKAILKVRAISHPFQSKIQNTSATNLILRGSGNAYSGRGIHLLADATNSAANIKWAQFRNINIHNVEQCVSLEAIETSASQPGYVNGNVFDGITCDYAIYGIHTENSGGSATNGNQFTNFQFQARADGDVIAEGSEKVIQLGDGSAHNYFQIEVWDWGYSPEDHAIENNHIGSLGNIFFVNGITRDQLGGINKNDILIGDKLPLIEIYTTNALPEASEGKVIYNKSTDHNSIMWFNGAVWKEVGGFQEYYPSHPGVANIVTGSTVELDEKHIGQGVYWTDRNESNMVTFDLTDIDVLPGYEVIFRSFGNTIRIKPESSNHFYDPVAQSSSANGKYLEYTLNGGYIHLRSYAHNEWTIITAKGSKDNGNWTYEP